MDLLSDELHLAWKRHMEAGFPYQIDLPYQISRATLASIVEFCEPHDVWSASVSLRSRAFSELAESEGVPLQGKS